MGKNGTVRLSASFWQPKGAMKVGLMGMSLVVLGGMDVSAAS